METDIPKPRKQDRSKECDQRKDHDATRCQVEGDLHASVAAGGRNIQGHITDDDEKEKENVSQSVGESADSVGEEHYGKGIKREGERAQFQLASLSGFPPWAS